MHTAPLAPFGIEIHACDLNAIKHDQADAVRRIIATARVAVFREQRIDDAGLLRFLRILGEPAFTEGETPVDGAPLLNVVSNVGRTTPPRSVFHTDTSYIACPPAFTALRAVRLPERGGGTEFSDQVAIAATLPLWVRRWLYGRDVLHRATGVAGEHHGRRHPLLRRHPLTGDTALYLSTPERCIQISGVDEATSVRVVRALYYRSTRSAALYYHRWRPGDVVIWDNRVTMHRADHADVSGDRVFHRGMVAGEMPLAARSFAYGAA